MDSPLENGSDLVAAVWRAGGGGYLLPRPSFPHKNDTEDNTYSPQLFSRMRRGTFTDSGEDSANTAKRHTNLTSTCSKQAEGSCGNLANHYLVYFIVRSREFDSWLYHFFYSGFRGGKRENVS